MKCFGCEQNTIKNVIRVFYRFARILKIFHIIYKNKQIDILKSTFIAKMERIRFSSRILENIQNENEIGENVELAKLNHNLQSYMNVEEFSDNCILTNI